MITESSVDRALRSAEGAVGGFGPARCSVARVVSAFLVELRLDGDTGILEEWIIGIVEKRVNGWITKNCR
jgi:hypothetical protein